MIVLLLFSLLSIAAAIVVARKVSNKILRYVLILLFSAIAAGSLYIIFIALKSGEM